MVCTCLLPFGWYLSGLVGTCFFCFASQLFIMFQSCTVDKECVLYCYIWTPFVIHCLFFHGCCLWRKKWKGKEGGGGGGAFFAFDLPLQFSLITTYLPCTNHNNNAYEQYQSHKYISWHLKKSLHRATTKDAPICGYFLFLQNFLRPTLIL